MGKKLIRITYRHLRRNEQLSFNQMVTDCIHKTCTGCGKPYAVFVEAANKLKTILSKKLQQKPRSLAGLDRKVSTSWNAFYMQLRASQVHPYADVVTAANIIAAVFDQVKNPIHLNYERQYGALEILIQGLSAIDASVFATALLTAQWDQMREDVSAFLTARRQMLEEQKEKNVGELEEAVKACSSAWTKLANYLEAKDDADELEGVGNAIDLLNLLFAKIESRLKVRATRARKKAEAENESEDDEDTSNLIEEAMKEDSSND